MVQFNPDAHPTFLNLDEIEAELKYYILLVISEAAS